MSEERGREIVKDRTCLKCGQAFLSNGPQNRICPKCTRINAKLGTISEGALQLQRGQKYHNGWPIVDPSSQESGSMRLSPSRPKHGRSGNAESNRESRASLASA